MLKIKSNNKNKKQKINYNCKNNKCIKQVLIKF